MDPCLSEPKEIITKAHLTWGGASAHQSRRVLVDSAGGAVGLVNFADGVLGQCGIRRASEKAPQSPIASTSVAPAFNEGL